MPDKLEKTAINILSKADIKINGNRDHDIQVNNKKLFKRVLSQGTLGLGESYMDGWWDCKRIDKLIYRVLRNGLEDKVKITWPLILNYIKSKIINLQKRSRAHTIGKEHYDIGNDLYKIMLDKRMNYSCAYWKDAKNLDHAQKAKLDLICKKLNLKEGMTVLDIGCGWGSFAKYAAKKYNVKVLGITVSKEQVKLARQRCKDLPVEIRLQDYRELKQKFDRVVSIGMFEHVGYKNYRTYMEVVNRSLNDNGLFLLHAIGRNTSAKTGDPWFEKYIFPNSMLPSVKQIADSIEGLFVMEDWHNFSAYYDKTLMSWYRNFKKGWNKIKSKYSKRFYRMWEFYLLSSAGSFRARRNQLWQVILSKNGVLGGYESIR